MENLYHKQREYKWNSIPQTTRIHKQSKEKTKEKPWCNQFIIMSFFTLCEPGSEAISMFTLRAPLSVTEGCRKPVLGVWSMLCPCLELKLNLALLLPVLSLEIGTRFHPTPLSPHTHTHARTHARTHLRARPHTHTHPSTHPHTHTHTCTHARMHAWMHAHAHA